MMLVVCGCVQPRIAPAHTVAPMAHKCYAAQTVTDAHYALRMFVVQRHTHGGGDESCTDARPFAVSKRHPDIRRQKRPNQMLACANLCQLRPPAK